MRAFEYVSPTSKEQVATLLGGNGAILAGGTDLLALMKDDVVSPARLVNIKQLSSLRGISYQPGNGLRIGALTTIAELADATRDLAMYQALLEGVVLFIVMLLLARSEWIRARYGMLTGIFLCGYAVARFTGDPIAARFPAFVRQAA